MVAGLGLPGSGGEAQERGKEKNKSQPPGGNVSTTSLSFTKDGRFPLI